MQYVTHDHALPKHIYRHLKPVGWNTMLKLHSRKRILRSTRYCFGTITRFYHSCRGNCKFSFKLLYLGAIWPLLMQFHWKRYSPGSWKFHQVEFCFKYTYTSSLIIMEALITLWSFDSLAGPEIWRGQIAPSSESVQKPHLHQAPFLPSSTRGLRPQTTLKHAVKSHKRYLPIPVLLTVAGQYHRYVLPTW